MSDGASDPVGGIFDLFSCCKSGSETTSFMAEIQDRKCGVGINFQPDATGALTVHSVVPGSPAAEDALICQGDLLEQVDGINVFRCSLQQVTGALLGREGSMVRLTFQRPSKGSTVRVETILRRRDIRMLRTKHANEFPRWAARTSVPRDEAGMKQQVSFAFNGNGNGDDGARSVHTTPRNFQPSDGVIPPSRFQISSDPNFHASPPSFPQKRDSARSTEEGKEGDFLKEAEAAAEKGNVAEAHDLFLKVLRLNPSDVDAMCGLATLLHSSRSDLLQAEALYQHALRLDPHHVRSLCCYGLLLRDKYGDDTGGEVFFKRALEADPNDTDTLCNYALLLTNVQKDHERASSMFETALQNDPSHVRSLCGYGMLMQNVNRDYAAAKSLFARALQKDPKHIPSTINLAVLYRDHLSETKAAESLIRHALKLDPSNPWLQSNAASFTPKP